MYLRANKMKWGQGKIRPEEGVRNKSRREVSVRVKRLLFIHIDLWPSISVALYHTKCAIFIGYRTPRTSSYNIQLTFFIKLWLNEKDTPHPK